jgi:hypothetical protein
MTANQAIIATVFLLEHFFGRDTEWFVRVVGEIPGHPDKGGHCDDRRKRITLVEKYLSDDGSAARIIRHEVAHALSPNDWSHGPEFKAALGRTSGLFGKCGPITAPPRP